MQSSERQKNVSQNDWNKGYNTSLEYTPDFQRFLIPDRLILTCLMQGLKPSIPVLSGGGEDTRKLVYCELGCGQGLTLNFLAARDPGGQYFGIDYHPDQIVNAQAFAAAGGITNISFLEKSFEDLAALEIPDCDIIVFHGVWSYISSEMQDHILAFVRRKLKPGGICYVSYNCMAGRNDFPLRELLRVAERTSPALSQNDRVVEAIEFSQKFANGGAKYFQQHTAAKSHLDQLPSYPASYTLHEYLNVDWRPVFFHEVAARMASAKLTFAGRVDQFWNRNDLALPAETNAFHERLSRIEDTEFLKDMWYGNSFRRDVYVKGSRRIDLPEFERLVAPLRFAPTKKPNDLKLEFTSLRGTLELAAALFEPILERLKVGDVTGAELTLLAKQHGQTVVDVLQFLFIAEHIGLCVDQAAVERVTKSCRNFDEAIWADIEQGKEAYVATLPGLGSGFAPNVVTYLMWRATQLGQQDRVEWAFSVLKKLNRPIRLKQSTITGDDEIRAYLVKQEIEYDDKIAPLVNAGMSSQTGVI
jgi:SAM-dependent methyltransferase